MYEGKLQEFRKFTQNDSKYHGASKYLENLNQVQSYLSAKIASRCRIACGLYCNSTCDFPLLRDVKEWFSYICASVCDFIITFLSNILLYRTLKRELNRT